MKIILLVNFIFCIVISENNDGKSSRCNIHGLNLLAEDNHEEEQENTIPEHSYIIPW